VTRTDALDPGGSTVQFRRTHGQSPYVLKRGIASDAAAHAWSVGVLLYACEAALEIPELEAPR
jgi:hypothetical protein